MHEIHIGHLSEFPARRGKVVRIGELELAMFRLSDGTVKAVENLCPHKSGKLSEGIVCDHHVYCPLHDWKIDLQDGMVQAPDDGCVRTFEVEVNDSGQVFLKMNGPATKVS